jgi:hypothetical protein
MLAAAVLIGFFVPVFGGAGLVSAVSGAPFDTTLPVTFFVLAAVGGVTVAFLAERGRHAPLPQAPLPPAPAPLLHAPLSHTPDLTELTWGIREEARRRVEEEAERRDRNQFLRRMELERERREGY